MKRLIFVIALLTCLTTMIPAKPLKSEFVIALKPSQSIDNLNRKFGTTTLKEIRESLYLISGDANSVSLSALASDNRIESAEVNVNFLLGDDTVTVCLLDGQERSILNGVDVPKAYAEQPALSIIDVKNAHQISTGAGTSVGIVDTGADYFHPAIRPWLAPGIDLVGDVSAAENDVQATLPDSAPPALGHGTVVAGLIHLVAPEATLVPIKAFDAYGNTTLARIVESVYRAQDLRLDVLNMSFSSSLDSPALRKAINAARASGMVIVSSIGNEGRDVGAVFPASYNSVLGVAATDLEDKLAPFSSYGKSVSLSAPGSPVISTTVGGRYAVASGTSFSAPLVSGTAALMASLRPRGKPDAPLMLASADEIAVSNGIAGAGRLNARKALDRIKNGK